MRPPCPYVIVSLSCLRADEKPNSHDFGDEQSSYQGNTSGNFRGMAYEHDEPQG